MRIKVLRAVQASTDSGFRVIAVGEEVTVPDHLGRELIANRKAVMVEPSPAPKQTLELKKDVKNAG